MSKKSTSGMNFSRPLLKISFQSFIFYSFISIISVPLALSKQLSWRNFLIFIYIGITITAIVGFILLVASQSLESLRQRVSHNQMIFLTLLTIGVAGVFRGYLLYFSTELGGFEQPTSLVARLISSTATTLFWLTLFSVIVEDSRVFKDRYVSILRSSILRLAQSNPMIESTQLSTEIKGEISEIQVMLSKTLDLATQSAMNHQTMLLAAEQVRKTVEENIRPLSHRLWLRSASSLPSIRIWSAIVAGLRNLNVPPIGPAALLALTSVFNLTSTFGWHRGFYGAFWIFIIFHLFFKYALKYLHEHFQPSLFANILFMLIPGFILSEIFYLSNRFVFDDNSGLLNFIYIVIFFIVAAGSSTYKLTQSDRNLLIVMLEKNLLPSKGLVANEESIAAENMASFLHNSLQSELLALSYQIEESAKDPNSENARALLERLGSRINRSINDDFERFVEKPLDRLSRIQSAWKGIASIDIKIPEDLLLDPNRNFLIVQIIEEAITNAVRFSKSTHISVGGEKSVSGQIMITIHNDGLADYPGPSGLGTEWLDRFAAGNWSRTYAPTGTTLEITL